MIICQHDSDPNQFTEILEDDDAMSSTSFESFAGTMSGMREAYMAAVVSRGLSAVNEECMYPLIERKEDDKET